MPAPSLYLSARRSCRPHRPRWRLHNDDLNEYYESKGIPVQHTMSHTPQQNGVTERINRTLMDKERAMNAHAGTNANLWAERVDTANYLRNRSPSSHSDKTPYELLFNRVPDVSHLRVWGCPAWMHARPCTFIGYAEGSKEGYRVLTPNGVIRIIHDVKFDEQFSTVKSRSNNLDLPDNDYSSRLVGYPSSPVPSDSDSDGDSGVVGGGSGGDSAGAEPVGAEPAGAVPRRSERVRSAPDFFTPGANSAATMTEPPGLSEPTTLKSATSVSNPEHVEWKKASDEEITSLMEMETWELVPLPPGRTAIPSKWVYKKKRNALGQVVRFKGRVVIHGVDHFETFAPCASKDAFRTVLAIACERNLDIKHIDIKTAFLNGHLEENIYMLQPPG
jgi:hypothetical protein